MNLGRFNVKPFNVKNSHKKEIDKLFESTINKRGGVAQLVERYVRNV